MAMTRAEVARLFDQFEGALRDAFQQIRKDAYTRAKLEVLAAAIETGDFDGILRAAGVREGMWGPLTEEIRSVYGQAGAAYIAADVPKRVGMVFNINNPRAEGWLAGNSAKYVTGDMVSEQFAAIREALASGALRGNNPRTTALDIVGRVSKQTGKRTGGIVNMTGPQSAWVSNARTDLDTLNPRYFTRKLRDKRFDKTIRKAMQEGKALPAAYKNKVITGYQNAMLKHRGDTIARTESLAAFAGSGDEALEQIIQEGLAPRDAVLRVWKHSFEGNERPGHLAMGKGDQERAVGEVFTNPYTFAVLLRPGDGPASEVINCFAPDTPIEVDGLKAAIRHEYTGDIIELGAGPGVDLTITPNHPILTQRGWLAASDINEGDYLIQRCRANQVVGAEPKVADRVTTAEQLYDAAQAMGCSNRVSSASVDFHGDTVTEDVDIVPVEGGLRDAFNSPLAEFCRDFTLADTDVLVGLGVIRRLQQTRALGSPGGSNSLVGCGYPSKPRVGRGEGRAPDIALSYGRPLDTKIVKTAVHKASVFPDFFSDPVDRIPFIKKASDLAVNLGALGLMACGRLDPGHNPYRFGVKRLYSKIRETGLHYARAYAHLFCYSSYGQVREALNPGEVLLPLTREPALPLSGVPLKYAEGYKPSPDDALRKAGHPTDFFDGLAHCVQGFEFVKVTRVGVNHYSGPVYNFETESGMIVASTVISHNCRCYLAHKIDFIKVERAV